MAFRIRKAVLEDVVGIATVHIQSWQTTYAGIIASDFLAGLTVDRRVQQWEHNLRNPSAHYHVLVAIDQADNQIVGFVDGGVTRSPDLPYAAEIYALYLLSTVQRRGIGRHLVRAIAERLLSDGYRSLLVWVLADNPSRGFYETLGGQYVQEKRITIGNQSLSEHAYGWDDITLLMC